MKKKKLRALPFLLAVCMLFGSTAMPVEAANPGGVEYLNTYVNTGNQRQDIIGVALTQLGYKEKDTNDTKYGDWCGYPYQPWCAAFVSWCARQADISTDIIKRNARAHPDFFNVPYYNGKSYTPKPGDLFFTKSFGHVGLVWYVEGEFFYCIEGNAKYHDYNVPDDPDVDSYDVMINKRLIRDYYFGVPAYKGCDKEHDYVKGYDASHPHKAYYRCKTCGDQYYTGYTECIADCSKCFSCGCSSASAGYYTVSLKAGPLKIRSSHSTSAAYVGYVANNEVVYVHGANTKNGWAYIEYEGVRGHVLLRYLTEFHDAPGTHYWNSGTVVKKATCKETGIKKLTCAGCDATKEEIIPVTNVHKVGAWSSVDLSGHSYTCSVCEKNEIEAHTWDAGVITKTANCKETGIKKVTCTSCNTTKEEIVSVTNDHKYGAWSNVDSSGHSHTCSVCGKEETAAHRWNSGTVTKKATCKETGIKKVTCTGCNATKTETVPKTDHDRSGASKVDADNHTYTCQGCGKTFTEPHVYQDSWQHDETQHFRCCAYCDHTKEAADHVPGPEATATADQICTVCNRVLQSKNGHVHQFAPSWSEDETGHYHVCGECGEKDSVAPHVYDSACDADCNVCGRTRLPPHVPAEGWSSDASGHWHMCQVCNEKLGFATHTPQGEGHQTCSVCQFVPHVHVFDVKGMLHSLVCGCEEVYSAGAGNCHICKSFLWVLICLLGAVAFLGVIVGILIRKKKQKKQPKERSSAE